MIRWTEQRDRYRLDVSFGWRHQLGKTGGLWLLIASGVVAYHYIQGKGSNAPLYSALGIWTFVFLVMIGVDLVRRGDAWANASAWVDIPISGGRARWGGPGHDLAVEEVAVTQFEVVHGTGGCGGVDALLPDGRRVRIFGPWEGLHSLRAEKIVEELNACLRANEGAIATPDVVPGGVQLEPAEASTVRDDPWRNLGGPYRVSCRRMDMAGWYVVTPMVVVLLVEHKFRPRVFDSEWAHFLPWTLGAYALLLAWWFWRDAFWIEVSRRGGPVRWGQRDDDWSRLPVVVARFAVGRDITPWDKRYPRYFPVAILTDGSHVRPLRHYRTWVKGPVRRRVEALNAALAAGPSGPP
mgnify:CR=1 FL=1